MRMRKKKNLAPRMERVSEAFINDPGQYSGKWSESVFSGRPVSLEIGCGKGSFLTRLAKENPDAAYIGLERVPDALVMAAEKAVDMSLTNIKFILGDADFLLDFFSPGEIEAVYVNFPDPWPKSRHEKRRLTFRTYLEKYLTILKDGGRFLFRTDNVPLFDFSLESVGDSAFEITDSSRDLHPNGDDGSAMTDYERKFVEMGIKINMLSAVKK